MNEETNEIQQKLTKLGFPEHIFRTVEVEVKPKKEVQLRLV